MKFKIISVTRNPVDESKIDVEAIAADGIGTHVGTAVHVVISDQSEIAERLTRRYNEIVALRDSEATLVHNLVGKEVEVD